MDPLTGFSVQVERPETPDVQALLRRHFETMRQASPEESCHVMAPDRLGQEGAVLIAVRDGDVLLGIGAIKQIGPNHAELKSMHTAAVARGRGVGRVVLQALMAEAQSQGMTRLSLETGSAEMFAAARGLYAAHGFETCAPFGAYYPDPLSVFMTRCL